jgi:mannose-6-phosphate isomerase-like protein (cupin superfamily)
MLRRRVIPAFKAAVDLVNYEDAQMIPEDVDPQVELSRNVLPQPFHLVIDEDTVLAVMSGEVAVHLKNSTVLSFKGLPGDHVYVPAGTPHRIVPSAESVVMRYTSNEPVRRGAAFFCSACGEEAYRWEWIHSTEVVARDVYKEVAIRFNDGSRRCESCQHELEPVAVAALGWGE